MFYHVYIFTSCTGVKREKYLISHLEFLSRDFVRGMAAVCQNSVSICHPETVLIGSCSSAIKLPN